MSSRVVGDMVVEGLKDLDPIAYIRYAIVYLGLDDLESVRSEIDKLLAEQQGSSRAAPGPVEASGEDDPSIPERGFSSTQASPESLSAAGHTRPHHPRDKLTEKLSARTVTSSEA